MTPASIAADSLGCPCFVELVRRCSSTRLAKPAWKKRLHSSDPGQAQAKRNRGIQLRMCVLRAVADAMFIDDMSGPRRDVALALIGFWSSGRTEVQDA